MFAGNMVSDLPEVFPDTHGDHVLRNLFAQANACVKAVANNVNLLSNYQVLSPRPLSAKPIPGDLDIPKAFGSSCRACISSFPPRDRPSWKCGCPGFVR
jgi:hypothetical protein